MPYSELIKNFNRIREYMREFYVYGFKSREEYTKMSARSYDDERRRMESWLGEYMRFRHTSEGKNVFISIDTRVSKHNPLYNAWKAKSFTDGDITLHFILMDILDSPDKKMALSEIMENIDAYLSEFDDPKTFDESTVRKKLKEYISEGIVEGEKRGRIMYYRRSADDYNIPDDMLNFFSEEAPCGVIGSFLLDKYDSANGHFAFKHHYITDTLDSEILCSIFTALREKRFVTIESINRRKDVVTENQVVPLKVMISAQNGRQYLMAYSPKFKRVTSFRIDNILSLKTGEVSENFDKLRDKFDGMLPHLWGVSNQSRWGERMEHVEFTVRFDKGEGHILKRLEREKRCGRITLPDEGTAKFEADVYDASEMIPWIRTFICRIVDINFSNKILEEQFKNDIEEMYAIYGIKGGEKDAVQ